MKSDIWAETTPRGFTPSYSPQALKCVYAVRLPGKSVRPVPAAKHIKNAGKSGERDGSGLNSLESSIRMRLLSNYSPSGTALGKPFHGHLRGIHIAACKSSLERREEGDHEALTRQQLVQSRVYMCRYIMAPGMPVFIHPAMEASERFILLSYYLTWPQ